MSIKSFFQKKDGAGKPGEFFKKEKPTVEQQIMEIGVRLRGLQRKYKVVIERELRALRGSRSRKQENPKAEASLKNAYYCLTIVNQAQNRLREITSMQELSRAMNEMGSVLKLMNRVAGRTEKVNTRALQKGIKGMEGAAQQGEAGMKQFFQQLLDALVGDDIIESLLKGKSLEECMDDQEGIRMDPADAVPLSAEYLKELGETEEPLADADMEQTLEDIEDMIRQM